MQKSKIIEDPYSSDEDLDEDMQDPNLQKHLGSSKYSKIDRTLEQFMNVISELAQQGSIYFDKIKQLVVKLVVENPLIVIKHEDSLFKFLVKPIFEINTTQKRKAVSVYESPRKMPNVKLNASKSVDHCTDLIKTKIDSWFLNHVKSLADESGEWKEAVPEKSPNLRSPSMFEFTMKLIKYIDKQFGVLDETTAPAEASDIPNLSILNHLSSATIGRITEEKNTQTFTREIQDETIECNLTEENQSPVEYQFMFNTVSAEKRPENYLLEADKTYGGDSTVFRSRSHIQSISSSENISTDGNTLTLKRDLGNSIYSSR